MLILPCKDLKSVFCFLRHARPFPEGPDEKCSLSPQGVGEALIAKEKLKNHPFDLVITSPAVRAKQTSELIAPGASVQVLDGLYELLTAESDILLKASTRNLLVKKLLQDLLARIDAARAKEVLVVAHGGVINLLGMALAPEHTQQLKGVSFATADGFMLVPTQDL